MAREWIFGINTFEVQTRSSFKKMLSLTLDHYGKLARAADLSPNFVPLRDDYKPLHDAFQNIYSSWKGAEGSHEGSTLDIEGLLAQLNTEIKKWEGTVRYVFPEDTPNERSIFPNKRVPFQSGTYEQRISAVKTLTEKLATFTAQPLLLTLSTAVLSFYNTIEAVRLSQTGDEISISQQSSFLENQRITCAIGMYGNLGRIMYLFRQNPVDVEKFWDMSLLRNIPASAYTEELTVDPAAIVTAALSDAEREKVDAATRVFFRNRSAASVHLKVGYSAAAGTAPTLSVTIEQDTERELSASELGWSSDKKYLVVQNEDTETGILSLEVDL